MRNRFRFLIVAALFFSACGYWLKVSSMQDPNANFTKLTTFKWLPKKNDAPSDPRVDNSVVNAKVRDSADRVMVEKGYELSNAATPDFLLAYHFATADIAGDDNIPDYWGYYPIYQGGIGFYSYPVEQGTLVIDAVDAKTMHLIWRGTGEKQLVENDSPKDRIERLESGVRKIMEQFPAR